MIKELSPKQQRFCEEYLIDLCGTQAAIRAGYKPIGAGVQANRLLKNAKIRAHIDIALARQSKRTGINAERVLRELAKIGFVNADDVIDFGSATLKADAAKEDIAAVASVKVKTIPTADGVGVEREIKLSDKTKALELLGKYYTLFTDKIEAELPINVVIQKKYE